MNHSHEQDSSPPSHQQRYQPRHQLRHQLRPQVPVWFLLAVMGLMLLTASGFLFLGTKLAGGAPLPQEELKIMSLVYNQVQQDYVHALEPDESRELMHEAIAGMVSSLDRYSAYIPPSKLEKFVENTRGIFKGIGVIVVNLGDQVTVFYPYPGGPAEIAGLEAGDHITKVGGIPVTDTEEAVKLIKGKVDTFVKLEVRRGEAKPFEVEVRRQDVRVPSVSWARILDRKAGIGYLYLRSFNEGSVEEFDAAMTHLESELGAELSGLVIDLRHNPGGLLKVCVELANLFLESGTIVTLKRRGLDDEVHTARAPKCTQRDLPLVVLLDEQSASASEVFAGAMQDHGRAVIVGVKSFGKGVVQSIYSWKDGNFRLKLTTSHYFTPKNRSIERDMRRPEDGKDAGGILPDREVKAPREERIQVYRALQRRQVPREYEAKATEFARKHKDLSINQPVPIERDSQLKAAVEELVKEIQRQSEAEKRKQQQKAKDEKDR